jgi:hypothetical protein
MSKYRDLAKKALRDNESKLLTEGILYEDSIKERMHPKLEEDLLEGRHSLNGNPAMPEGDERTFEMKLIAERFKEVVNRCREAFDVDVIDEKNIMLEMMPMVDRVMEMEEPHIKELEKLAVEMIMEEFDITDENVIIEATLTPNVILEGVIKNPSPQSVESEFNDHDEIVSANANVYKRRFLNAMTQGASKKTNHMFHMRNDELNTMNPRLVNNYKKMMSAADYVFYMVPDMETGVNGGACSVDFNANNGEEDLRPVIKAEAMVFPVLIHELVKGVMEVLSAHGLPTEKHITEYVINKADYLSAEPWDMRLGPAMWSRFCNCVPAEDFNLKHHVYADLAAQDPETFNHNMKNIMANTKKGHEIVETMLAEIKREFKEDDLNEMDEFFNKEDLY